MAGYLFSFFSPLESCIMACCLVACHLLILIYINVELQEKKAFLKSLLIGTVNKNIFCERFLSFEIKTKTNGSSTF